MEQKVKLKRNMKQSSIALAKTLATVLLLQVLSCPLSSAAPGDLKSDAYKVSLRERTVVLSGADGQVARFQIPDCPTENIEQSLLTSESSSALKQWLQSCFRGACLSNPNLFQGALLVPHSCQLSQVKGGPTGYPKEDKSLTDAFIMPDETAMGLQDLAFYRLLAPQFDPLKETVNNTFSFRARTRRLDRIVQDSSGSLRLVLGKPKVFAPEPTSCPNSKVIVSILAPSENKALSSEDVIPAMQLSGSAQVNPSAGLLPATLTKLNSGKGLKISFWGDSVTAGGFASDAQHEFACLVLSKLRTAFPNNQISFINCGVPGSTTSMRIDSLQAEILAQKPDLVIVEFVNDYKLSKKQAEENYGRIIRESKAAGVELLICVPHPPLPSTLGLSTWHEVCASQFPSVLRHLCSENKVAMADVAGRWDRLSEEGLRPDLLLADYLLHPNDYGHRTYAEEIVGCFAK